jgi:hypothetical protein
MGDRRMGIQRDAQRFLGFAFLLELRLSKELVKKSALGDDGGSVGHLLLVVILSA